MKQTPPPMILKRLYPAHGSDGKTYEVHVYVAPPEADARAPIEKIAKVCTSDGHALRVVAHRQYELVGENVTLHADDPDAV